MSRMFDPPHPGDVLKAYLDRRPVAALARHIGVSRVTLQRIVNGAAGISPDMAYRLAAAFGTSPELWAGMQLQYDLHAASKLERPPIERITA
ncbi:HigA family addiction module antitoxin [Herbaspirillum seropedicae]|uniref:HigA family addiction module antitoxin n=1 Tax=Herbaspirillum seropedicae TaxID=964 RepID=UPI0008481F93|nr:HigA family addiction module antitoxin [Herbaspirillum seropedicae]AON56626.1 plasmid maintenance system antidote protein [Herbaspirillum seropedicae]